MGKAIFLHIYLVFVHGHGNTKLLRVVLGSVAIKTPNEKVNIKDIGKD